MFRHVRRRGALILALVLAPAAALGGLAAPVAAAGLQLTTPYPAVTVDPGGSVTFPLTVTTPSAQRVDLAVTSAPSGWSTAIRGGGNLVDAVFTGSPAPSVELDVNVPSTAKAGTYTVVLTGTAPAGTTALSLGLVVAGAGSGGGVSLTSDFPNLKGAASASFSYDVTLANETAQKLTLGLTATGPSGWQVNAYPTGQTQAQTASVAAGSTSDLTVSVTPASDASAGTYPITLQASAGQYQATVQLQAQITGSPQLALSTSDGRLNAQVTAGSSGTLTLVVTNNGSAPADNVGLTDTPPSGWQVAFSPSSIPEIAANSSKNVTVTITPSSGVVAGDYDLTLQASGGGSTNSVDIRATVQTSPLWGFVGALLIVAVLVGLGWVFRRYGRR